MNTTMMHWVGPAALGIALAALPLLDSTYALGVGFTLATWIALALSWSMFSGLTGYVSLGHVVFYGIGATTVAMTWGTWPIWAAAAAGGAIAVALAFAVGRPCLKVRGPYFVMLTFGLAEFVKYVVIAVEARMGSGSRMLLGAPDLDVLYWLMLALAVAAFLLMAGVRRSRMGEALRAIREDETAAETIGIDAARFKTHAYALSALIPALVGALLVLRGGYFEAHPAFDPTISLTLICIAVIGGSDSPSGPLVGALFLVGLQELLWTRYPNLYMVVLGVALITFIMLAPRGIVGTLDGLRSGRGRSPARAETGAAGSDADAARPRPLRSEADVGRA
ncbi:MAG: branched-chain amino acid ABC transporter permease [Lautropia sp.]